MTMKTEAPKTKLMIIGASEIRSTVMRRKVTNLADSARDSTWSNRPACRSS